MYKVVILVQKREDLTYDEFVEYWHDVHGPMADDLPNLVRYTRSLPFDTNETDYDGLAQLYFESKADLKADLTSDVGQELQADLDNFVGDHEVMLVEEEQPIERAE